MLAVVVFPHGSITVLTDVATLSQAHLIQPGRALGAEPQVRSSFRESLQLYMQLRVALQSSTPTTRGDETVGSWVCLTNRKMVSGLAFVAQPFAQARPGLPTEFKAHLLQSFLQPQREFHARQCQGRKAFSKNFPLTHALLTEEATHLHLQMNGASASWKIV